MTSKEKAEDLVNKMYHEVVKDSTGKSIRCAIIAVDEILATCPQKENEIFGISKGIEYLQEVKQHLEEML